MVDVAQQAFSTQNFDLAAEIYERQIKENGPTFNSYLGLADSLARAGNLRQAFVAYRRAFRLGKINPNQLHHLVKALIKAMSEKEEAASAESRTTDDIFSCELCKTIWDDPVTIKCGHTFCRKCLIKTNRKLCKLCDAPSFCQRISNLKTNVLLASTVESWFPKEVNAVRYKSEGNKKFSERAYEDAIELYTKALRHAPTDHLILSNRCFAYQELANYSEALKDAEKAVQYQPKWPKGYFRKGESLSKLGRHQEATVAYLKCLSLDQDVTSAKTALATSLHKVLSPVEAADLKLAELQTILHPFPFQHLLDANCPPEYPEDVDATLSDRTLQQLKTSLQDTLAKACRLGNSEFIGEHTTKGHLPLVDRSMSAPTSRPHSPKLKDRIKHAVSDLQIDTSGRSTLLPSRKRSNFELEKTQCEPSSPCKGAPPKQKRSEESFKGKGNRQVSVELLNKDEFECSLCYRMLFQPVTTPCGHSFCKQCLSRSMDHSSSCPLCKSSLVEYLAERRLATTEAVEQIIQIYFPEDYAERQEINKEELAELARMGVDNQHEIPIFVCALAFPSLPCPLHIFEPRYRLMVRQCMESGTRQFGMCIATGDSENSFSDFGCMLEIRDVQYFPDGRSVVDTVGGKRFKVLSRGAREGYNTAKVEFLKDARLEGREAEEALTLHTAVHAEAKSWYEGLPQGPQNRIQQHFGNFPELEPDILTLENGPVWMWWLTAILPLDPRAQLSILAMTSLKERLAAVKRVLGFVKRRQNSLAGVAE